MQHTRRKKKTTYGLIVLTGLIVMAVLFSLLYQPYLRDLFSPVKNIATKQVQMGNRTLFIAPHPDDEALGGAGIIQKALAAGKQVQIVMMTTGDGYKTAVEVNYHTLSPKSSDYRKMAEERRLETLAAMKLLGVKKENVLFLGYPDGGMKALWETNWDDRKPLLAINGANRSPYAFGYEQQALYCGENVVKNLTQTIQDFQPTDIVYPDPNDEHPDHWATHAFIKYVLAQQQYPVQEWTYLVHRGDFPAPWLYEPNHSLTPPHALVGLDTNWISLSMNKREEQKKDEAIRKYVTQVRVMDPFLEAFVRTNELVGTYVPTVLPVENDHLDFDQMDKLPAVFSKDPVEDTVRKELHQYANITSVGGVLSNGRLNIMVETRAPVSQRITYNIRLRLFQPDHVDRVDMSFHNAKLTSGTHAANSIQLSSDTAFRVKGNRLWLSLPAGLTDQTRDFLISADTYLGQKLIDKTAWQLVRVR